MKNFRPKNLDFWDFCLLYASIFLKTCVYEIACAPKIIVPLALDGTQWAAETIQCGWIKDPPQMLHSNIPYHLPQTDK